MTKQNSIHTFCENIRLIRRKNNLTCEEMASRLKIDVTTLELLENDVLPENLYIDFLDTLSDEFAIPVPDLFAPLA